MKMSLLSRRPARTIKLLIAFFTLLINPAFGGSDQPVIVQLADGTDPRFALQEWIEAGIAPEGMAYVRQVSKRKSLFLFMVSEDSSGIDRFIGQAPKRREVLLAYLPTRLESRFKEPNDPFYANQWHMEKINAPEVWEITTGGSTANGKEIVIALMDYGFQVNHPDLVDNLWVNAAEIPGDLQDNDGNGYIDDYLGLNVQTGNDKHPSDFHGTGAAGLIGARGDNMLGVSGVNWNVKILLFSPMEYTNDVTEALEYCMDLRDRFNKSGGTDGTFVVATSLSLGVPNAFPGDSPELTMWCELYEEAGELGILNAVAAPNANVDIGLDGDMPSLCPSSAIIAVTNTDQTDRKVVDAGYNNENIDLGAPGDESFTTYLQDGYREFGGCSAATPHVAGAIGLLYSLPFEDFMQIVMTDPARGAQLVRCAILEGAEPLRTLENVTSSGGRLDLLGAMEKLREKIVDDQLGDNELEIVSCTPNPADDLIRITYQSRSINPIQIGIYNVAGQLVREWKVFPGFGATSTVELPVDDLSGGVYFISLRNHRTEVLTSLIVY